jgi:hypothetical protein
VIQIEKLQALHAELTAEGQRAVTLIADGDEDDSGWRRRALLYAREVEQAADAIDALLSWYTFSPAEADMVARADYWLAKAKESRNG